jgi:hypothetical protein
MGVKISLVSGMGMASWVLAQCQAHHRWASSKDTDRISNSVILSCHLARQSFHEVRLTTQTHANIAFEGEVMVGRLVKMGR